MIAQTLMRLLQMELDEDLGPQTWWSPPDWNKHKKHPSILDIRRLMWKHREAFSHFLVELEEMQKVDAKTTEFSASTA